MVAVTDRAKERLLEMKALAQIDQPDDRRGRLRCSRQRRGRLRGDGRGKSRARAHAGPWGLRSLACGLPSCMGEGGR